MSWQSMQPKFSCLQAQLNALVPEFFPMHQHKFAHLPDAPGLKVFAGDNLMRIHLRPKREEPLDYSALCSGLHASGIFLTRLPCQQCDITHSLPNTTSVSRFNIWVMPSALKTCLKPVLC